MKRVVSMFGTMFLLAVVLQVASFTAARADVPGPHLSTLTTFSGRGGYSADGLGQVGTGGTIQADVPTGSTVEQAYLYGTYFGYVIAGSQPSMSERTITVDTTDVVLDLIMLDQSNGLATGRADVTSLVSAKVGSGGPTPTDFTINSDPFDPDFQRGLDGVGLLVIYSNPSLPSKTISVVDGGANPFGDSATFSFPSFPLGGSAQMSLGIGFSYQGGQPTDPGTHTCGTDSVQSSEVDINVAGNRLTSCAGNYDDGFGQNGALITVGGVGDSTDNPSDPFQQPGDGGLPRVDDDELYDLSGFLSPGATSLSISTTNPSDNDNLFLAVVQTDTSADLSVTKTSNPTTVTSGQKVQYAVTATNNGPDDATGVTVTDTLPAGFTFVQSDSSENCSASGQVVTCSIGSLSAHASSSLSIVATAPTVTTQTMYTDTATISGDQTDPNRDNNTAIATTTVTPTNTADYAAGFYDGVNTLDIQTAFGKSDTTKTETIVPPSTGPGGYQASPVTDTEYSNSLPQYLTYCGGTKCTSQIDVTSLPTGSQPDSPIQVILYTKDNIIKGTSVYAQGDGQPLPSHLLSTCDSPTVARVRGVPTKCVASITTIKIGNDKVQKIVVNVDSGSDPTITKK